MGNDYGNEPEVYLPDGKKTPAESKDFELSWAVRLDGDTIATSEWVSEQLTVVSSSVTGSKVSVRLSGGRDGSVYTAQNTIVTAVGNTFRQAFAVKVEGDTVSIPVTSVPPTAGPENAYLFENGDYRIYESGGFFGFEGGSPVGGTDPVEPPVTTPDTAFLLESGDFRLTEAGDYLVMENA